MKILENVSRVTVVRDIGVLLKAGYITKEGKGRGVRYKECIRNELLRYTDTEQYFSKEPDEREVRFPAFNFDIFANLQTIILEEELEMLTEQNTAYQERLKKLSPGALQKEFERLTIELSWKSSHIEGNTYSLIDTEILIKEHKEAEGHKKEEAVMILNHKKALDYIHAEKNTFKKLTRAGMENIHTMLISGLGVATGIRKAPVGIVGTRYTPLDNEHQIKEAVEKTITAINKAPDPFSKALVALCMISYIQPFADGNKRTARLLGDALLLAHNACPLSFRSIDEGEYKKALILFYEQNNLRMFKDLFIEQFTFATENYFR